MGRTKKGNTNNVKLRRSKRLNKDLEDEDRLSSLPDDILTDIISRLQMDNAVATSVLSHRWRHLWTGVTRIDLLDYEGDDETLTNAIRNMLPKLTCSKLRVFYIWLHHYLDYFCEPGVAESCFHQVCRRNVEEIIIQTGIFEINKFLVVPAFVFKTQSLVSLELRAELKFEFDFEIRLPNLKKLILSRLMEVYPWLETLCRSCTLLEHLNLLFTDISNINISSFNIFTPNLRKLIINMHHLRQTQRTKIFIDAPKLENLKISDPISYYYFHQNPTAFLFSSLDLTLNSDWEYEPHLMVEQEDYLHQMSKFVGGMSNVSQLELSVEIRTNICSYFNPGNQVNQPIFPNLTLLKATLKNIGLIAWKDLLVCMQHFPELQHLEVENMEIGHAFLMEFMWWSASDSVPDCLVRKLETIKMRTLNGTDYDLKLLAYILSNATVLEELHIDLCSSCVTKQAKIRNEYKFLTDLYNLPRSSSTCEIMFKAEYVRPSKQAESIFRPGF